MNADKRRLDINNITEQIIGCSYKVSNTLGCGFLEKVYENALVHELRKTGLQVKQQYRITVYYDGVVVGEYVADFLVEECVLVELKAIRNLTEIDRAQCLNVIKATKLNICLLINFGTPRIEIKRVVQNF
jgi:GxxExxY protein